MFRETSFGDVEHVSVSPPLTGGGEEPRPLWLVTGVPWAIRMAAPPTTWQKLAAEFLGTGFLVFVGAGSAAATGVIAAGTKAPFSLAELGMISYAVFCLKKKKKNSDTTLTNTRSRLALESLC